MNLWRWVTGLGLVILRGACTAPQPNQQTIEPEANYWQQLGSSVARGNSVDNNNASLAQTSSGIPVIAYGLTLMALPTYIYVKFWTGIKWVQVGNVLDANPNLNASLNPSLALDSFW